MNPDSSRHSSASIEDWSKRRTFKGDDYSLERVVRSKSGTVSIVLPARNVAPTIGGVLKAILPLQQAGVVDELTVIDAGSTDATAEIARSLGVETIAEATLMPEYGPSLGKGDALWRGLAHSRGDVIAFFDTDTQNFGPHFVLGLLGPLFENDTVQLVKAAFHRPLQLGGTKVEDEGGRVTELVARPLINIYFPALAGFIQPLAGEVAIRRTLIENMSMPGGYGVEIAMLIDALEAVGIDALAQTDIGRREDVNQSLRNLTSMAFAVASAVIARSAGGTEAGSEDLVLAWPEGIETHTVDRSERPPLVSLKKVRV